MTKYTCEKCGKEFKQKSHYETHLNKVQPCVTEKKVTEVKKLRKVVKKLKNVVEEKIDDVDEETENIILEDDSNIISNKDALRDKIHQIHNYLRNHGAGYGMNALKVFNILYGLKKIEESGLLDTVSLKRPECEFSHLLKLSNGEHDEELAEMIFTTVLDSIAESNIRPLLFYELPSNITGSTFAYLIKEINKITLIEKKCNVLLSGKIYEYFIGRDESAISELGAYFTDRHITKYIYDKVQPILYDDGTVGTMIDMFGGSGGFTTGYVDYLNEHNDIDWSTEILKIHHYDMNEDVIKSAALEIFCLTGTIPNMNNIKYKNSFKDDFIGSDRQEMKYDYIITNPPYGGDTSKKTGTQIKRDKIKEHIKKLTLENPSTPLLNQMRQILDEEKADKIEQNKRKVSINTCSNRIMRFASDNDLKGNDKEACSLMLMMELLENDGVCAGVLKEGVFFNPKYKNLRKYLIENYNVSEIISVPQDQFENTSTKTSIIIFSNTGPTEEIIFREMVVEKVDDDVFDVINGNVVLTENEGDISGISDRIISQANRNEILENKKYSFNGKDYNLRGIKPGKGYKLVKLGDICTFLPKSTRKASYGSIDGEYNFYTSSDKVLKCDEADYENEAIIIGTGGNSCIHHVTSNFSASGDTIVFNTTNNHYVYYTLLSSWNLFTQQMYGSTIKHVTKSILQNYQIPIPKSDTKMQYWIDRISTPYLKTIELEQEIKDLEEEIKNKITEIIDNEECEEVCLGDICDIKTGKNKTPDNKLGTLYPYYGTSKITGYTDHYLFDGNNILVARNGTIGNCFLTCGKIYPSDHVFIIQMNDVSLVNWVYYYIKNIANILQKQSNGSTIAGITKDVISNINIKIPTIQIKNKLKNIISKKNKVIEQQELYDQYLQELKEEAINE